ncbi:MAG: tRNA (guanosine(37)-N1)-methyltransferase TrmD, partial [Desulfobulbaceae bacterium]|nr:tRNA (guanosine(37)-N1)-methyltransferase TrmD [Desulfobulbaceae bacterium]
MRSDKKAGAMRFDVLTIFPDLLTSPLGEGIIRRAIADRKIEVNLHNVRQYALDKQAMTDDRPFGGGEGMVMKPEPLSACM